MLRTACLCLVGLTGLPAAAAQEPSAAAARQVAGLFMQSCLQFAGDRDALRGWAKQMGLKALPTEVQEAFLHGLPGVVFDASNKDGKFVVVSQDAGSCSAIAEMASGPGVVAELEKDMTDARIVFKVTAEKADSEEKALRHREYLAAQGQRQLLLLVSTVKDPVGGQAMLTVSRD